MRKAIYWVMSLTAAILIIILLTARNNGKAKPPKSDEAFKINVKVIRGLLPDSLKNRRIVVLNLWASWCKPCLVEMPELSQVQKQFRSENTAFVGITMEERSKAEPVFASQSVDFTYTKLYGQQEFVQMIGEVRGGDLAFPLNLVIKDNEVVFYREGYSPVFVQELKDILKKQ